MVKLLKKKKVEKKMEKKMEKKIEKEPKVKEIAELVEKLSGSAALAAKINSIMRGK